MKINRRTTLSAIVSAAGLSILPRHAANAASADDLIRSSDAALKNLYALQPRAKHLAAKSKAILVFPSIIKAGFIVGAQTGEGVLFQNGLPINYYNTSSASYGLQAGVQSFSLALFFMKQSALTYLEDTAGWSVGVGPSVVVLDQGAARSMTSTTLTQDVYAVPFGQQGLMAGLGIEGTKITQITPGP